MITIGMTGKEDDKFCKFFEMIQEAILVIDLTDGRYSDCNSAFEELTGFKKEELLAMKELDLTPDNTRQKALEKYAELRSEGRLKSDSVIMTKNRGEIPVEVNSTVIRWGEKDFSLSIIRDISDRIEAEVALRQSEERYREMIDNSLAGIYISKSSGEILYANKALLDFFGFPDLEEMRGTNAKSLYADPKDRDRFLSELSLRKAHSKYGERFLTRDGKIKYGIDGVFYKGEHLYGMIIDATDLFNADQELKASEKRYRQLFENANSIILRWSVDRKIADANPFACVFFGYRREEMVGKDIMFLLPEKDHRGVDRDAFVSALAADPDSFKFNENMNLTKGGRIVWVSWANYTVKDENGNVVEILAIGNDITRLKETEEELKKAYDEQKKMNELKSTVLRDVSHDLKHPIHMIRMASQSLQHELEKLQPNKIKLNDYISMIKRNSKVFDQELSAVLELSRLDVLGSIPKAHVNLNELVKMVIYTNEGFAERKGIAMKRELQEIPEIRGNAEMLTSLVRNLVMNALKYTDAGSVTVRSGFIDDVVFISVTDTGIGMRPEDQKKLFEPYFKARPGTPGLGVGLAICKRIADLHNGRIEVVSVPGKGSTFKVVLPL